MALIEFSKLLTLTQTHISDNYPGALNNVKNYEQIKPAIQSFLRTNGYFVEGISTADLVDTLYSEMVQYSFLTDYLNSPDVDEININAWDDVSVTYLDGRIRKLQSFHSSEHATDVVRKMLKYSGATLDDAIPVAQGHLPGNTRITAIKAPLVDKDVAVSASIRLLHPSRVTVESIIAQNNTAVTALDNSFLNREDNVSQTKNIEYLSAMADGSVLSNMILFLCCCMRYGVSFVVAGATFSGKTTLLNALLKTLPDEKRVFTIEAGTRELDLVKRDENGKVINNVVHTLARRSEKRHQDISMEDLVVVSLRFNPDLIVVGEMRDEEAYAAIDASLTGHTLVSTVHSFAGEEAHMRLATLCQKKYPVDLPIALMQAAKAFPVVCFEQKLEDGTRKITDVSECQIDDNGRRKYKTLFRYVIEKNEIDQQGHTHITGHYEQVNVMSSYLRDRMLKFGIPSSILTLLEGGS